MADGVSDVWFRVTDLEVASGSGLRRHHHGRRSSTSTSRAASPSRAPGHCHPHVVEAIQEQAARFIHAQVNVYRHTRLGELADRLAAIAPPPDRHVLLRQLRRRGHRGGGEAGQAGHRSPERDRVPGQLPRPHPPGHGDDDVEDRLPRRPRTAAVRRVRRAVPEGRRRGRRVPRRRAAPAAQPDRARGDRRHAHRAGARRGRLRAGADRVPPGPRGASAASTASSSSPTRCRPASVAPARCSASSSTASVPTSS